MSAHHVDPDGGAERADRDDRDGADRRRPPVARRDVNGLVADTITFSSVDGPGNRFVVFLQGCNFDCVACHNPQTIPGHADLGELRPVRRTVGELVVAVREAAPFVRGVTVSGGEATQQASFVHALLGELRSDPDLGRLTSLVDSNGACPSSVWDRLRPVFDGAMIDLKCLDPDIHRRMTGQSNALVLASIRHLHRLDRLHEVRLLVVPGLNDDPDLLRRTGEWLASVDPAMRVKVIGFRSHGVRPARPALLDATPETVEAAAEQLAAVGAFDLALV